MKAPRRVSIAEALLPLLFFSGEKVFYAAILIPLTAGFSVLICEALRRFQARNVSAAYILLLALCGGLGWAFLKLPPYWTIGAYFLVPEGAWQPSESARSRPAFSGFKKYSARRAKELIAASIYGAAFAAAVYYSTPFVKGPGLWAAAILACVVLETAVFRRQGRAV